MQQGRKTTETVSRRVCSVPQCSTKSCTKEISLHRFPINDVKLCKKWQLNLRIGKPVTKFMQVCSEHFTPSDFFPYEKAGIKPQRRRLKKTAVPSQNIPILPFKAEIVKKGHKSVRTCRFTENKSTQTGDKSIFQLDFILNNNENLNNLAGISQTLLKTYVNSYENVASSDLTTYDMQANIILVMCKLKLNISFPRLAVLFKINSRKCRDIFHSTVTALSSTVRHNIYWLNKEVILQNMPKCFARFKDTRIVFDCIEIKIQKFNNLNTPLIISFSQYKTHHTAKFLIGVTPSGIISYISKAHGGIVPDKNIFNEENIISKLESYDAVMVDKGVLIKKECEDFLVKVYQLPVLVEKKKLKESERLIAQARVHIERTIQRIKAFKIFQDDIPWYMTPYLDDIMTIVGATVNLSSPILADDKIL